MKFMRSVEAPQARAKNAFFHDNERAVDADADADVCGAEPVMLPYREIIHRRWRAEYTESGEPDTGLAESGRC
nr:hypothetical protein Iba_chr15cCG8720 [Ipomoea batatas]